MINPLSLVVQRVFTAIDYVNDRFTSYRLVLYFLLILLGWTIADSFTHQFPYTWQAIAGSAVLLVGICWAVNRLLARLLNIPANKESDLISGLILTLILTPASGTHNLIILAVAAAAAMASKYVLVYRYSHIFNPAAMGAFVAGAIFHYYPSWWVGAQFTTPLMIIGAVFILRKIKRYSLALVFSAVYVLALIWTSPLGGTTDTIHHLVWLGITSTSLFFFTSIMLIEPLTSPAGLNPSLIYALLVGVCYSFNQLRISPEESLLIGNVFTFLFAPNRRYKLSFVRRIQEAEGIYSYVFSMPKKIAFRAGQYMEWTLSQHHSDSRGNRRYLTISSAPSDQEIMFSLKEPPQPSAFKKSLAAMKPGDTMFASYLSGSFTLPSDANRKLVFLAGGVGITPFHSMIKELVGKGQKRDMVLVYSANKTQEFAFRSLWAQARAHGLKDFYTNTITPTAISKNIPDYKERDFYISGPYAFVKAMEKVLLDSGISAGRVVADYFPGYS